MEDIVRGGKNVYGFDIGVLMLDSDFPRVCGDIGNARTWDFPVLYKKVEGKSPGDTVMRLHKEDIRPFMKAAQELEKEGVKAITTSCGFLSLFQEELSSCVNVPVFTSALLFVPMLVKMLGRNKKIGILTANKKRLTSEHLKAAGVEETACRIVGLEDGEEFTNFTVQNRDCVNIEKCRNELIKATMKLTKENDVEMIVLECTNMPPYARNIQEAAGVPVFDIVLLTSMVYGALNPKRFLNGI